MNPYRDRVNYLTTLAEKYFQAETDKNPTLQNNLLRQMTYTADRLFIAVFDFLYQIKEQKMQQALEEEVLKKQQAQKDTKTKWVCRHCGKSFATQKGLQTHLKVHKFQLSPLFSLNGYEVQEK